MTTINTSLLGSISIVRCTNKSVGRVSLAVVEKMFLCFLASKLALR